MTSPQVSSAKDDVEVIDLQQRQNQKLNEAIVTWTNEQYRRIRTSRSHQERQWYMNLAFYFGKQHVAPLRQGTQGFRLIVPPAPYYRVRPVHNRIRAIIRSEIAQLTNGKPNASVVPASAEDKDMYAAMAGEQIWETEYREKRLQSKFRRAIFWSSVTGTGYLKTVWDANAGPVEQNPETGEMGRLGDIVYTHETPFHILVPSFREEEIENQPFVIHSTTHSPEIIAAKFGKEHVKAASPNNANELIEDSFMNLMGDASANNKQDSILMHEVWMKPGYHPEFKEGAFFTVIGKHVVQGWRGLPFKHGMYPFAKFDSIPSGKYYSTSVIEDLIPLQKEYNRTHGQIIEAKNRMAKPQLLAPKGSIEANKVTSEPGQIIFYNPGLGPPVPLQLSPLPSYVMQEMEAILVDMNDIAGQHEISRGQVPPGVTAATAISFLQERDESKLTPAFDSQEEAIEKTAKLALNYVQEFWTDERIVKVTGPDGSFDAMTFSGADLRGNTDIRIEAGSSLPTSKAAKQAFVMDLMKMGFIPPDRGLEVMDMGGINKIYEQVQLDRRQAQRENMRMAKVTEEMLMEHEKIEMERIQSLMPTDEMGNPIPPVDPSMVPTPSLIVSVNNWDNHVAHIEVHNNYRKGQAFENLPEYIKMLFDEHVKQHVAAMGAETITMNPEIAAGLPPGLVPKEGEEQAEESRTPGPEAAPETMEGEM